MATTTNFPTRKFARFIAAGILLSMIVFYLLHYWGTWEAGTHRPDAETTSSVIVYNKCAVLGTTHILWPGSTYSSNNVNDLKLAGSFMNFFNGHVISMIVIAIVLGILLFMLNKAATKKT